MIYRTVHGLDALDFSANFTPSNSSSRGHQMKLTSKQFSCVNSRAFGFANPRVDAWSSFDNDIICTTSLSACKIDLWMLI